MKSGPELDSLIAEKVMEWKVIRFDNIGLVELVTDEERLLLNEFRPSRDIVDAWKVVEKLKSRWPDISISTDKDDWNVSWGFDGHGWPDVSAETAPLAICLAALKSEGLEIPND